MTTMTTNSKNAIISGISRHAKMTTIRQQPDNTRQQCKVLLRLYTTKSVVSNITNVETTNAELIMYQVTIVSAGSEIGYGEGESLASAKRDAMSSLDSMGRMYIETFGFELIVITE